MCEIAALSGSLGLADGAAEVPLVDSIELIRGGEVHFLHDVDISSRVPTNMSLPANSLR